MKNKVFEKGTFTNPKLIIGKRLKRSLKQGSIIKDKYLKEDWLVHKNQKISIENQVGSVLVTMEGIALNNGIKGDRILVNFFCENFCSQVINFFR